MKLYIKQKVFSWGDKFRIYDENGNDLYSVAGEVFTLGKKLHLYGPDGSELAFIHQKLLSLLPRFFINRGGTDVACVVRKFTLLHPDYRVEGLDWAVNGDIWAHDYTIGAGSQTIAAVSKRWVSWGDTYEIDIAEDADEIMALCVVLVIDAVIAQTNTVAVSVSGKN